LKQALEEVLKPIKDMFVVGKGGVGKSTVYDTNSMDSLQQRKAGMPKSLCSVDLTLPILI